uniref:Uncharacterized protein n=1 Tax=Avena sativa TaxID=4498 RepID=A0ACD5Y5Q1_AVESA
MAVADDPVNPSPPPPPAASRIVVAVLALVRVAGRALPYLGFAIAWVLSAIGAATAVAHLAWGEDSAPFVFLLATTVAAVKVGGALLLVAVLLCGRFLFEFVSGSDSELKKSTFGVIKQEATQVLLKFPRAAALGLVADLAFILLIFTGILVVMMSSPVDGSTSQGELIGSVIVDVGIFGAHAISCFVIIPALALDIWRVDQSERKVGLPVADC